ncbi:MAG: type II toxin-antitoxin system RelE family toxin [Armatimonadota bacterium]
MPTPNLSKDAHKFIKDLLPKHAKQVLVKILDLCQDPEPADSILLKNSPEKFRRTDIGEYRIIYKVDNDDLDIYIIGKRNDDEVYQQFNNKNK